MEIKITSGLPANQELSIQAAQLRRAQTASSFSLRLNAEGKLDQRAFSELLTAARVSSAYKANQQHYQFKLKSDGSGHYLTLKQQGLWSRFKGVFGWGRETRERQRADAELLIRGMSLSEINQAISLVPNNPNHYNEKYVVLSELKRYDEELAAITQAINLAPRAAWYYNRGILYYNQQKYKLALDDYNKAIELNPNYALAYYNRGNLYRRQQKYKLALDDYNQAIKINPNDAELQVKMNDYLIALKKNFKKINL